MIGRATSFASGALALLTLTACGADSAATSVAAEQLVDVAAPSTTTPADVGSDDGRATEFPADPEWGEFPNPAWPPVTLAPGEPPVMPASVNVIGDSIALSAQPILTPTIESLEIEILAYDAVESRRLASGSSSLPSGVAAIEDVLDDGAIPELWIVALGTNDIGAMGNAEKVRADLDRVLDLVPENSHLIWVDTWIRDNEVFAVEFNAMVRSALTDRPYAVVLDWHGTAASNDELTIDDGVHLSDVGKVEYARMIGDGLRDLFTRP